MDENMDLHTLSNISIKFQVYSTNRFRVMCNTNFSGRTYGRTDVRTYRRMAKANLYAPLLKKWRHNKTHTKMKVKHEE